jgi:hypothetical protein
VANFSKNFPKGLKPNFTWAGPTPGIGDLPVHMRRRPSGAAESISCWELGPGEYQEVVRTGKVYLSVWGTHPPVLVASALHFAPNEQDEPSHLARRLEQAREAEVWFNPEVNEFINQLLENAPDDYDDDASASAIAVKYVRDLEAEVMRLRAQVEQV